jgi:adenylate kinase
VTTEISIDARSASDAAGPRIVLLGPPASGKGTQGRRLAEFLNIDYLSTGALLRREVAAGSPLGAQANEFLERGQYLPDDLMESILANWFEAHGGGWVLDGFPRTLPQARWLDERFAETGGLTAAVALEAPQALLEQRVADRLECQTCRWTSSRSAMGDVRVCPRCGGVLASREDDDVRNFRSRYESYVALTIPAVHHYLEQGKLVQVDGAGSPDDAFQRLITRLNLT